METEIRAQTKEIALDEILVAGGVALLNRGKFSDAGELFEKALALKPNDAYTLTNLGHAYAGQGKPREAADAFHKAIRADPLFSGRAYEGLMRTLPKC